MSAIDKHHRGFGPYHHQQDTNMQRNSLQYHPDYGLTDEIRIKAVRDAQITEVKVSAKINRVSVSSIYKWRKRAEDAA